MIPRESDFFLKFDENGTSIWTGVVEDRNDPAMMGRVRVRIFGIHAMDRTEVPTEALPWATVILPTTMAALSGIGSSAPGIIEGTWVIGFFRDGASCQDPVVLGAVLGNTPPNWDGSSHGAPPTQEQTTQFGTAPDNPSSQGKITVGKEELKEQTNTIASEVQSDVHVAVSNMGINSMDDFPDFFEEREEFDKTIDEIAKQTRKAYGKRMSDSMNKVFGVTMDTGTIEGSSGADVEKETRATLTKKVIAYQKAKRNEKQEES